MGQHSFRTIACGDCGYHFRFPVHCGNRFCPICNKRRQARCRRRLQALINAVRPHKPYSTKHIVLTIPNQPTPEAGARICVAAFRRLRQRHAWKRHVRGGVYVIEVQGRPNNWHVHLHIVAEAKYWSVRRLADVWSKCGPGRVTFIADRPHKVVLNYITKYITKSALPEHLQMEASAALRNFRLFQPFGSWHSIKLHVDHPRFACPKCGGYHWLDIDRLSRDAIAYWGADIHRFNPPNSRGP